MNTNIRPPMNLRNYLRSDTISTIPVEQISAKQISTTIISKWSASEILPNLYLGDIRSSNDEASLRKYGITGILRVLNLNTSKLERFDGIEYCDIELSDSCYADIHTACRSSHPFIEYIISKGGKVLVHCHEGISRSPTVVISYLMKYRNISSSQAFNDVVERRSEVCPNISFCIFLSKYVPTPFDVGTPLCISN